MWHVTCDTWHVTRDTWYVTHDMWHVTRFRGWTFSQNFSSLALTVCDLWYYEGILGKGWLNQLISNEAVWRTAPATPGLSNIRGFQDSTFKKVLFAWLYKTPHHYDINMIPNIMLIKVIKMIKIIKMIRMIKIMNIIIWSRKWR